MSSPQSTAALRNSFLHSATRADYLRRLVFGLNISPVRRVGVSSTAAARLHASSPSAHSRLALASGHPAGLLLREMRPRRTPPTRLPNGVFDRASSRRGQSAARLERGTKTARAALDCAATRRNVRVTFRAD